jgi:TRAP-type C4-dicarboxylate transport system substrate-binding protein
MCNSPTRLALVLCSLSVTAAFSPALAAEKPVQIKLATIAPRGSSYHQSLVQMGENWRKVSGGTVQLGVYPDGTLGSEADTVGLMQTRNLQASLLTVVGLAEIEPAVGALQYMPMAFRSLEEVDYVGERLRPRLERSLDAKGYLVLFWTDSGWVRFFTKAPVLRPDDMRKLKIFSWAGSAQQADLWKSSGFTPVSLETASIGQALMSGTISAVPVPPIFALFGQIYTDLGKAKYMLEINWAPLVGALVVRKEALEKVPQNVRDEMIKGAVEASKSIKANGRVENEKAVDAMIKRGLIVNKLSPETEPEWRAAAEKVYPMIRGSLVPGEVFDEAMRLLKDYRQNGGK